MQGIIHEKRQNNMREERVVKERESEKIGNKLMCS